MKSINKIHVCGLLITVLCLFLGSCNENIDYEQYKQYVSFKAPTIYVSKIRLKYRAGEPSLYHLPLIVSGTTNNKKNLTVHVGLDPDTLDIYNQEHFYHRKDLYFKLLPERFYNIPSFDVTIPSGENSALMDINFSFDDLDLSEKWILPLIIKDDKSYNYQSHPRKNYNNALLYVLPFNDYSGTYQTTNLSVFPDGSKIPLVASHRESYVVNENTIFFYAGASKENRPDRKKFKIFAEFIPVSEKEGNIRLYSENEDINFLSLKNPTYKIVEKNDAERPYLVHRTVNIENIEYTFQDPWETLGYIAKYKVKGTMSMQRNINTLISDEEFSIEW